MARTRQDALRDIYGQYGQHIKAASDMTGLDPNAIMSLIYTESAGKPDSISNKNAYGLTQMLPATAVEVAQELGYTDFTDPGDLAKQLLGDPELSILFGAHYFKKRLDESGGDYGLAYAGYHSGPNNPAYRSGMVPNGPEVQRGVQNFNDAFGDLGGEVFKAPNEPLPNVANEYVRRLPTDTASGGVPGLAPQDVSGRVALSNIFRGISPTMGMAALTESRENPLVAGMRGMVDAGTAGYGDPTRGEPAGESRAAKYGHAVGMGAGTAGSFVPANIAAAPLRAVPYAGRLLQPAAAFGLHSAAQRQDTPEGVTGSDALAYQMAERAKAAAKGAATGAALGGLGMVPGVGALMRNPYTGPFMDAGVLTGMQAIEGQPLTPVENLAFVGGMRGASAVTEPLMPKTRAERDAADKAAIRQKIEAEQAQQAAVQDAAAKIAPSLPRRPEMVTPPEVPVMYADQYTGGDTGGAVAVGRGQFRAPAPPNVVEPLSYDGRSLRDATVPGRRVFRKPYQPFNPEQPQNTVAEAEAAAALDAARQSEGGPRRKGRRSRTVTLESGGGQAIYEAATDAVGRARSRGAAKQAEREARLRAEVEAEMLREAAGNPNSTPEQRGRFTTGSDHPLAQLAVKYLNREVGLDELTGTLFKNPEWLNATPEALKQIIVDHQYGNSSVGRAQFTDRRRNIRSIAGGAPDTPIERSTLRLGETMEMVRELMNNELQSDIHTALQKQGIQRGTPEETALFNFLDTAYGFKTTEKGKPVLDEKGQRVRMDVAEAASSEKGMAALKGLTPDQMRRVVAAAPDVLTQTLRQHGIREGMRQTVKSRPRAQRALESEFTTMLESRGLTKDNPDTKVMSQFVRLTQQQRNRGRTADEVAQTKAGQRILSGAKNAQAVVDAARDINAKRSGYRGVWSEVLGKHEILAGTPEAKAVRWLLGNASEVGTTPDKIAQTDFGQKRLADIESPQRQQAVIDAAMELTDSAVGRKQFEQALRNSSRYGKTEIGFQSTYMPHGERSYSFWKEPRRYMEKRTRPQAKALQATRNPNLWSAHEQARSKGGALDPEVLNRELYDVMAKYSADTARMFANSAALKATESVAEALRYEAKQVEKTDGKRADEIRRTADALSAINQQSYNGKLFGVAGATIEGLSSSRPGQYLLQGVLDAKQAFNMSRYTVAFPFMVFRQWTSMGMTAAHGEMTPAMMARALKNAFTPELGAEWQSTYTHWVKTRKGSRLSREGSIIDDSMIGPLDKPLSKAGKVRAGAELPTSWVEDMTGRITFAMAKEIALKAGMDARQTRAFASDVAGLTSSYYDKVNRAAILSDPLWNLLFPAQSFALESMNTANMIRKGQSGPRSQVSRSEKVKQAVGAFMGMYTLNLMATWLTSYHKDDPKEILKENLYSTLLGGVPYLPQALGVGSMASDIYTQQMTKDAIRGVTAFTKGDYAEGAKLLAKDFAPGGMSAKRAADAIDLYNKGVISEDELIPAVIFGPMITESGSEYIGKRLGKRKGSQNAPSATNQQQSGRRYPQRQAPRRTPYRRPQRER